MKKGFTLIEILIVITIIGILTTLGTMSYVTSLKAARDTRRKTDLEQIRQALESYRSTSGIYPVASPGISALKPSYMTTIPTDPSTSASYGYLNPTSTTYSLCTKLENSSSTLTACASPYTYEVQNP